MDKLRSPVMESAKNLFKTTTIFHIYTKFKYQIDIAIKFFTESYAWVALVATGFYY